MSKTLTQATAQAPLAVPCQKISFLSTDEGREKNRKGREEEEGKNERGSERLRKTNAERGKGRNADILRGKHGQEEKAIERKQ